MFENLDNLALLWKKDAFGNGFKNNIKRKNYSPLNYRF